MVRTARPDRATLERLYLAGRLSSTAIAAHYGVNRTSVKRWLHAYGISARHGTRPGTYSTCERCGASFYRRPSESAHARFCSMACYRPDRHPATCESCGTLYVPRNGDRGRFCSNACRQNRVSLTCSHCGLRFSVMASKAGSYIYCSMACKRAASVRIQIVCPTCAIPFTIVPSQQATRRFCSRACAFASGRATIVCAYCGIQHTTRRYRAAEGQQCCSTRCATLLRMDQGFEPGSFGRKRQSGYRTDIERMTEVVLI